MTTQSSREGFVWSRKMKALVAGLLLAAVMAASVMTAPAHASNVHTVNEFGDQPDTNPGDGICNANTGPATQGCTLRAAIQEANDNPGADRVNFNLPFLAPIQPTSQLPAIRNQTTIDGYTQPGASPNTLAQGDNAVIRVELNGRFAGNAEGLSFQQSVSGNNFSNSVVRGLAINHFSGDAIFISGGLGVR